MPQVKNKTDCKRQCLHYIGAQIHSVEKAMQLMLNKSASELLDENDEIEKAYCHLVDAAACIYNVLEEIELEGE